MKIGFIGAGKMGFTLGKHFVLNGLEVGGYFSQNEESANLAADFTNTHCYHSLSEVVNDNDVIFLTVPDGQIAVTAKLLDGLNVNLDGKILCHTSGACSSQIFSGMDNQVYGYSIHPIYAVNSKTSSYVNFKDAYITIEGDEKYLSYFQKLFLSLGHNVKIISANDKVKYHSAAVFASNLVIGLYHKSIKLMCDCGFDEAEACEALKPLFKNNADNLINSNCLDALTGPVQRCDTLTVKKHIEVLDEDELMCYKLLSKELVSICEDASDKSYDSMKKLLDN